ncbi:MAG: F0F1 ATP synthase subunit A, partial [Rickettsiales bacterium]|nr:F0F1 ATP synthase subunit A [Rickettsiales bacterium]
MEAESPVDTHEEAAHHEGGHSPLTQFEVHPIVPFKVGGYDLSFTNASLWMVLAILVATGLMFMGSRKKQLVPGRWQSFSEVLAQFVSNTVRDVAGESAMKFFPIIFTLFMFVLFSNVLGMLPY